MIVRTVLPPAEPGQEVECGPEGRFSSIWSELRGGEVVSGSGDPCLAAMTTGAGTASYFSPLSASCPLCFRATAYIQLTEAALNAYTSTLYSSHGRPNSHPIRFHQIIVQISRYRQCIFVQPQGRPSSGIVVVLVVAERSRVWAICMGLSVDIASCGTRRIARGLSGVIDL